MPARLVYVQSKGLASLIPFWGGSKQNSPFALLPGFLFSDPYKSNLLTFPKIEIPTFRPGFCFAESKAPEPNSQNSFITGFSVILFFKDHRISHRLYYTALR